MLMSVVSHLLSAWFAFLLPCYATWKALAHRPVSDAELERWGMYWAVVGAFVAFEYVAIWLLSWIPFYWETRTAFLLFLALPQTQGSTYVYVTYMQPFLIKNQAHIDAGIEAAQTNMLAFLQTRFVAFWQTFWNLATKASATANQTTAAGPQPTGPNPVAIAKGLWSAYSPSLMGAFGGAAAQPQSSARTADAPVASSSSVQPHASFSEQMANGFVPTTSQSPMPPAFPEPEVPAQ